jgi:hypothetical protein
MKIKFSKSVKFVPTWNGNRELPEQEQIKTVLSVLKFGDLQRVYEAFPKNDGNSADRVEKFSVLTLEYLPKHCVLEGLEDDDGPVELDRVISYPTYTQLASEILMEIIRISSPKGDDEKN